MLRAGGGSVALIDAVAVRAPAGRCSGEGRPPSPGVAAGPDPPRGRGERRAPVRPPGRGDDGEPLVRQLPRDAPAPRPAAGRRVQLRRRGTADQQQPGKGRVDTDPARSVSVHARRQRKPELERHPPPDRRRPDGRLRANGRIVDDVLGRARPAVLLLAREDLLPRQPLVLLGAVPDVSESAVHARRDGIRPDQHRHLEHHREPAERDDLRPAERARHQLDRLLHGRARRQG